jgi:spermidine synthase
LFYYLIVFAVASCSLAYELVLAQTITVLYGSTILNYTLIIGIYIFSLGMGAAIHARYGDSKGISFFWCIELLLSFCGALAPFLILYFEVLTGHLPFDLVTPFTALLAMIIGVLSGMEVPLLLTIALQHNNQEVRSNDVMARNIIGLDFIGTFFAAGLVPVVCFPFLGIVRTAVLTASVNGVIGLVFLWRHRSEVSKAVFFAGCFLCVMLVVFFFFAQDLSRFLFKEIF